MLNQKYLYAPNDEHNRNCLIGELFSKYPFLKKECIGVSHCGREIPMLSFGTGKEVLFACAFHGMEWLTTLVILRFLDELLESISKRNFFCGIRTENAFHNRTLCVVPCVNPDGVEISINGAESAGEYCDSIKAIGSEKRWQANAAGVDINHNFNAGWKALKALEIKNGINAPAPTRFGGKFPESEPESRAMARLCRNNDFIRAFAFHSQGEEIYWSFGEYMPENARLQGELLAELSGYTMSEPDGLAVGGGFKDWFVETFNSPAFTIEIGNGKNPLPISDLEGIYERLKQMLLISIVM